MHIYMHTYTHSLASVTQGMTLKDSLLALFTHYAAKPTAASADEPLALDAFGFSKVESQMHLPVAVPLVGVILFPFITCPHPVLQRCS